MRGEKKHRVKVNRLDTGSGRLDWAHCPGRGWLAGLFDIGFLNWYRDHIPQTVAAHVAWRQMQLGSVGAGPRVGWVSVAS